jgi:hypothetical protein
MTARMGASVGRLLQEVLLEEFYSSWCSETVRVGRVRVFQELPTVFNCSLFDFWSARKFHREQRTCEFVTIYICVCVNVYVCLPLITFEPRGRFVWHLVGR